MVFVESIRRCRMGEFVVNWSYWLSDTINAAGVFCLLFVDFSTFRVFVWLSFLLYLLRFFFFFVMFAFNETNRLIIFCCCKKSHMLKHIQLSFCADTGFSSTEIQRVLFIYFRSVFMWSWKLEVSVYAWRFLNCKFIIPYRKCWGGFTRLALGNYQDILGILWQFPYILFDT